MSSRSETTSTRPGHIEKGTRLYCQSCGSMIEIINPCTCEPSKQKLECCGKPMTPTTEVSVHVNETS